MDLNGLKTTVRAYAKISKSIFNEFVKRDELGNMAWQNDAPIGTTDSYVRKNGAWVKGASDEEITETLKDYVIDVPTDMPENRQYARQHKKWVEVEAIYHRPDFLNVLFIGLLPSYEKGDIVSVDAVVHSESNIVHINNGIIYVQLDDGNGYTDISEIYASENTPVKSNIGYSFILGDYAKLRLKIDTDIGNTYYSSETLISGNHPAILYTGTSILQTMTPQTIVEVLERREYKQDVAFRYVLNDDGYVWWCTNFELSRITQSDGLAIDYDKVQSKVIVGDISFNCYRTREKLIKGNYIFKLYGSTRPEPEPEVLVGDLRIGGSLQETLTKSELSNLTKKDFSEDRIFEVNTSINSYIWICTPNDIYVSTESGMEVDFVEMPDKITIDDIDFICYRSKEMLFSGKWQFKLNRIY